MNGKIASEENLLVNRFARLAIADAKMTVDGELDDARVGDLCGDELWRCWC